MKDNTTSPARNRRAMHIIVAAGSGSRFGAELPKQFVVMGDRPVIYHTVEALRASSADDDVVVVVISPEMIGVWNSIEGEYGSLGVPVLPLGGPSRAATVANVLRETQSIDADVITVHDAARPLLAAPVMHRLLAAVRASGSCGAVPVVPLTDSLRHLLPGGGSESVARADYRAVQTPQAFPAALLRQAYAATDVSDPLLTDDASVVELFTGSAPELVEGDCDNIKITHPSDLRRAELIMCSRR